LVPWIGSERAQRRADGLLVHPGGGGGAEQAQGGALPHAPHPAVRRPAPHIQALRPVSKRPLTHPARNPFPCCAGWGDSIWTGRHQNLSSLYLAVEVWGIGSFPVRQVNSHTSCPFCHNFVIRGEAFQVGKHPHCGGVGTYAVAFLAVPGTLAIHFVILECCLFWLGSYPALVNWDSITQY